MSRNGASLPASGPQLADVARLFVHLTTEWVTDLGISIEAGQHTDGTPFLEISVQSPRLQDGKGGEYIHKWSKRRFSGVDYTGSYAQLYDLLIVAYREIEREFERLERRTVGKAD